MTIRLRKETEKLIKKLYTLESMVEESLSRAVEAVGKRNQGLAKLVIENDNQIDQMEVELEEECLKILALYQPVAGDLRMVIAILKMNNDLERIGDLAANIGEKAVHLATHDLLEIPYDFNAMATCARNMLKGCFDALSTSDADKAQSVREMDDKLDTMNREMYSLVESSILKNPENLDSYIHMMGISRNLERMGDLAVNIAEDVIYMVEGSIVRHIGKHGQKT
ncbi:phosphate signaling complex protein PhoU [Myxococcota bacterium]|nr:phosphate signaling complex protein PhoU [Myxococcota bacterium]MBU1379900.1 phosphate signaling complex protein PhoU [Myxococcota bacterium]MBU1497850.1 phosphate signaling complex protein PhoU [Myxococcota bacterium]